MKLSFKPLTRDQWNDFVYLFGERGACGGCWCMLWRLTRKQFELQVNMQNRKAPNWWKVILLNPNPTKTYRLLLHGPAHPQHSFMPGLKRFFDVHRHVRS